MQEKSPREVEREFGLKDKALESLRDRASGFAGMVAAFCQRMKFTQLELLIAKFQASPPLDPLLRVEIAPKILMLSNEQLWRIFRVFSRRLIGMYADDSCFVFCAKVQV